MDTTTNQAPPTGRLAALAAEHNAKATARAQRAAAKRPPRAGSTPATAVDPERCRAVGRTLTRPAWWPEEAPAWSDWEADAQPPAATHRPTHGRRRGGWCPTCREQRSRTGECWCGSDERATTRKGSRQGSRQGGRPAPKLPAWVLLHRATHATPETGCWRCEEIASCEEATAAE